jgi:type VI protein secretion system component VasK
MVILQDLAFPDPGRDLQGRSDSSDDSGSPFHMQIVFCVAGGGLLLFCAICCISCLATWRDVKNAASTAAPVRPQHERAVDAIQSTLLQRKHAILELLRTSRVTMVR